MEQRRDRRGQAPWPLQLDPEQLAGAAADAVGGDHELGPNGALRAGPGCLSQHDTHPVGPVVEPDELGAELHPRAGQRSGGRGGSHDGPARERVSPLAARSRGKSPVPAVPSGRSTRITSVRSSSDRPIGRDGLVSPAITFWTGHDPNRPPAPSANGGMGLQRWPASRAGPGGAARYELAVGRSGGPLRGLRDQRACAYRTGRERVGPARERSATGRGPQPSRRHHGPARRSSWRCRPSWAARAQRQWMPRRR